MADPHEPGWSAFDVCSRDPEWAHHVLREAYADFTARLTGQPRGFRFTRAGFRTDEVTLARVHYGAAAEMDVAAPVGALHVAHVAPGSRLVVESGRESARSADGRPLLMPPDHGWRCRVDGADVDTVSLSRAAVRRVARAVLGDDAADPEFTSMHPVSPSAARYWQGIVTLLRRTVRSDPEVAGNPLVLAESTRTLATAALVTFPHTAGGAADAPGGRAGPAVLRRALAYIDEHAAEDVGVDDIAAAARIGVRGLQHLFRTHRGRPPLAELRRVRMARAHADLRAADPTDGTTVGAVAARWGFGHAGRFAVEYRRRYGRPPSETLQEG